MIRTVIFVSIVTASILLVDIYVYQALRKALSEFSKLANKVAAIIFWSITAFSLLAFFAAFIWPFEEWPRLIRTLVFSFIMIIYLGKLFAVVLLAAEDLTRGIRWVSQFLFHNPEVSPGLPNISRSKFISQAAMIAGGVPLALGIHGMVRNAYNYQILRERITLPNLPDSFNGLKIVQISDIHAGSFALRSPVEKGVEMILDEKPDLIFFTGDLVNYVAREMDSAFIDLFKQIKAKEGVYSVFGNHDYADYVRFPNHEAALAGKAANYGKMVKVHHAMGWDVLLNENRILRRGNDSLAIIGSENWSMQKRFRTYGDMSKAYKGCEQADVKLLLSHDPSHWDGEIRSKYPDIDVMFSGHTHGAQFGVEIPGYVKWSPVQYLYKQWAGLYREDHQYLYVNRGFGFIGYHGRIGILPEIAVIELAKA